ncbi:trimeric intracellular cation channel family protein [Citrifermentans bremense]|uniref:trimeric intracellular cation channel family protein n=1 Tax=Citrifermentans bremense TaxID=60035 RepID=UPI0004180484|nr:trimeric intracellular cation channel family protein [Citrifermentans bremense]
MNNQAIIYAFDLLGTVAFAASGALAGVRRGMDLLGVIVLGIVTATGGGVMRDVLLNDTPPFCFKNELYLYLAVAASVVVFLTPRSFERMNRAMLLLDALGLGTFLVIGTSKALQFNLGLMGAIIMGVMTATCGGLVRDLLSNQIPLILQREIYASACVVGGALFYFLHFTEVPNTVNLTVSAVTVIAIRCAALVKGWQLPRGQAH